MSRAFVLVPSVATMVGQKTEKVCYRYAIVDEANEARSGPEDERRGSSKDYCTIDCTLGPAERPNVELLAISVR